ncbi:MAG: NotI family restriction endonuclease [Anaerolineae bacterium]
MPSNNHPAEIFGYPIDNVSHEAQQDRQRYWCPFMSRVCSKTSRLLDFPFGVCSVQHRNGIRTTCPHRFEEPSVSGGAPRVIEDIARHYFGDLNNVISFAEVGLPNVGMIDYVLVRHKPMKAEVDDFVLVEFQTDSTTSTGAIVQALRDFMTGQDITDRSYAFGMNTYDTIKRAVTQLLNKGIVYEAWGVTCYWVIQEYIYADLVHRYGLRADGYVSTHASRFALYGLVPHEGRLTLKSTRFVSTTVDELFHAMRHNPGLPDKQTFVNSLNVRLHARLKLNFS